MFEIGWVDFNVEDIEGYILVEWVIGDFCGDVIMELFLVREDVNFNCVDK